MASYIISLDKAQYADSSAGQTAITNAGATVDSVYGNLQLTFKVTATAEQIATIAGVVSSDLIDTVLTASHAAATYSTNHLTTLSGSASWVPEYTGAGAVVYLMDTGVNAGHSEFTGSAISDFYKIPTIADYSDVDGHGTAIASLIVGQNVGTAPAATLKSVKLFNASNGTITVGDIIDALDAILADHLAIASPTTKVVCMPWVITKNQLVDTKLNELRESNLLLVAAAGNNASDVNDYTPGGLDTIVTVGSVSQGLVVSSFCNMPFKADDGSNADYSNLVNDAEIDIFAPGEDVHVALFSNNAEYNVLTGTSCSAGIVAGVVAQFIENNSSADAVTIKSTVMSEGHMHASRLENVISFASITPPTGQVVDSAKVSYSVAYAPQVGATQLASHLNGRLFNIALGDNSSVNLGINPDATNVAVLEFSPVSPWMTLDLSTGVLSADTAGGDASLAPGVYNFAIKGTVDGQTIVEEYSVGVYNTSVSELDDAPEYYYDTDTNSYEEVVNYSTAGRQKP